MKTTFFLAPILGAAVMAVAAEPAVTNTPPPAVELSAAKDSTVSPQPVAPLVADQQSLQRIGERIALSGALTKAPPSKARTLVELVNPFAPVEPQPTTRWIERSAWSTVATKAVASSTPEEIRHEPQFGISLAGK